MKGFIVYQSSEVKDNKQHIYLFGRLENGETFLTINHFRPYFYICTVDRKKAEKIEKADFQETTFVNFEGEPVTKVTLNLTKEVPQVRDLFMDAGIRCYEADIRYTHRFLIDKDIKSAMDIEGDFERPSEGTIDRVYEEPTLKPVENYFPKLKMLSIDIETNKHTSDLYAISLYMPPFQKVLIKKKGTFKNAEAIPSEELLLERFKELVLELDPDILTGWSFIDFDLKYLQDRFKKQRIDFRLGRINWPVKIRISDSYFKDSTADLPGRMVLDGIHLLKISHVKLDDYKLETAAKMFVGEGKIFSGPNRYEQIDQAFEKDPQLLIDYNLKDAKLAYDVIEKSDALNLTIRRSILTRLPMDRVQGSIAALDSVYLKELQNIKVVAPTAARLERDERIKGGYVLEPKPDIYDNIIVLDFKSLYPSIMRTFNIDPYTFIPAKKAKSKKNLIEAPNGARFKREEGVLSQLIQRLWEERDAAKKRKDKLGTYAIKIMMNSIFGVMANPMCRFYSLEMANAITSFGRFFIKQAAAKAEEWGYHVIYGDSVDGKTKIIIKKNNRVYEEEIADLFTKTDRKAFEKEYDCRDDLEVLTLDENGKSVFKPIKYVMRHKSNKRMYRVHFTNNWSIDVTEDHSLIGYQSLAFNNSKKGKASALNRIIELKPTEIKNKANTIISLKKIPYSATNNRGYPKEVYEFMGYFIGDGSFSRNKLYNIYKKDYYLHLSLGVDQEEVLNALIIPLQKKGFIKNYWLKKTRKGDITINGLKLVRLISENFSGEHREKKIPKWLFNESEENIASFLRGLFSADGSVMVREKAPIIKYTSTNEGYINCIRTLLYRVGIAHSVFRENSVNRYKTKNKMYSSGTYSKNILIQEKEIFAKRIGFILERKNKRASIPTKGIQKRLIKNFEFSIQSVKNIEEIRTPEYVYDLEVEGNHRFFANYVLVHNTDSLFINPREKSYEKTLKIGADIQQRLNTYFTEFIKKTYKQRSFLEVQFEKVFKKFFLPQIRKKDEGAKKRYAGLVETEGKEEIVFVGLETVRRDWTYLAKKFQQELLDRVFHEKEITNYIRAFVKKLREGIYDDLLVYRKGIRKAVEEYTKTTPPHIQAARKIGRSATGIIEYIQTTKGPEPLEAHTSPIDYDHYIKKQLQPIADSILVILGTSFEDILKDHKQFSLDAFK